VQVVVTERNVFDAPETGILIASALEHLYAGNFDVKKVNTLLANQSVLTELENGENPGKIASDWEEALHAFEERRKAALLYPEP